MKRLLAAFFLALLCASLAPAIEVGDTTHDMSMAFGKAVAVLKKADGSQVYRFKNGTTVWLADGVVQKITGPNAGSAVRTAGSTKWDFASAKKPAAAISPGAPASAREDESAADDNGSGLGYLALFGGLALSLVMVDLLRVLVTFLRNGIECLWSTLVIPFAAAISSALAASRSRIPRV